MGGIYFGVITATEGAAMGAMGAMIFALARKVLTWNTVRVGTWGSSDESTNRFMPTGGVISHEERGECAHGAGFAPCGDAATGVISTGR